MLNSKTIINKTIPLPKKLCPMCRKAPQDVALKPFCSKRCADEDLLQWLNGAYVLAGESAASVAEEAQEE
jgi:uncharacterized protein